jgi:hypothetical protein
MEALMLTPAEREQRRVERDAREKKMVQHLRARVLGNLTFDEIKEAALKLPDVKRAELLAVLIAAQVDALAADNLGQGDS